jgi:hypothetical protein
MAAFVLIRELGQEEPRVDHVEQRGLRFKVLHLRGYPKTFSGAPLHSSDILAHHTPSLAYKPQKRRDPAPRQAATDLVRAFDQKRLGGR